MTQRPISIRAGFKAQYVHRYTVEGMSRNGHAQEYTSTLQPIEATQ
jgi:hypothetical protein